MIRVFKSNEKPSNHLTHDEIDDMLEKVSLEDVKKELADVSDPEEQMEILMRFLELQDSDLKTRTEIAGHIQVSTRGKSLLESWGTTYFPTDSHP